MESPIKERLKEYIRYKNLSVRKFEQLVGLSNGYVNGISQLITRNKLSGISREFPELNIGWLLSGDGEMLKQENKREMLKQENKGEGLGASEKLEYLEKIERLSDALMDERDRIKEKEYVIKELLGILKENNIPVKITEIEKGASRSYGESQEGSARNVG